MYISMYSKGSYKREERQGVHKKTCKVLQKGCNKPGHGTGWDVSAWLAALPKVTEDATSDLSQPSAQTNHIPSYVSWNVDTRSEEVSSLLYLA